MLSESNFSQQPVAGPEAWFYRVWTTGARVRAAGGKKSIENASKAVQKSLDRCLDNASPQSRRRRVSFRERLCLFSSRSHKAALTTGRFPEELPATPSEVSDPGRELGMFLVSRTGAQRGTREGKAGGGPLFPLLPSGTSSPRSRKLLWTLVPFSVLCWPCFWQLD